MERIIHVSKNGTGDYHSMGEALKTIPLNNTEPVTIFLHKGIYQEKLVIDQPYITVIGDGAETTVLTYADYARMKLPDQSYLGTFRTQTLLVYTHDFTAKDLAIENSAGYGKKVGQAIALYVDGDRNSFHRCRILGSQDTLFTGPLPPEPNLVGGFTGPLEYAPRINGRQHYLECYIRGDIDFIFGSSTAYFEKCELFSQKYVDEEEHSADETKATNPFEEVKANPLEEVKATNPSEDKIYGYITAASTPKGQEYGYVFDRCRLTGDCPPNSVYLGRPWRNYAQTVFLECELGEHIRQEGFHDWGKAEAHSTISFSEYRSYGLGANNTKRASFSKELSEREAGRFKKEPILW